MERQGGGGCGSGSGGGDARKTEWPEWLPKTWEIEARKRKDGRVDKYFMEPEHNYVFRSKIDALRYMELGEIRNRKHKRKSPRGIFGSSGNVPLLPPAAMERTDVESISNKFPHEYLTSRCEEERQDSAEGSHMTGPGKAQVEHGCTTEENQAVASNEISGLSQQMKPENVGRTRRSMESELFSIDGVSPEPNKERSRKKMTKVIPDLPHRSSRRLAGITVDPCVEIVSERSLLKTAKSAAAAAAKSIDNSADSKSISMTTPVPLKVHKIPPAMESSGDDKRVARKLSFENLASSCEKMHQQSAGPFSERFPIPNSGDAGCSSSAYFAAVCIDKAQVEQDCKTRENQAIASHETRELTREMKPEQMDGDWKPIESDFSSSCREAPEVKREDSFIKSASSILNDQITVNASKRKSWNDVPIRTSRNKQASVGSSMETDLELHAPSWTSPSEPVSAQHGLPSEGLCKRKIKADEKPIVELEERQMSISGVDLQDISRDEPVGTAQANLLSDKACRLEAGTEGSLLWQKFYDTEMELPETPALKAEIAKRIGDRLFDPCIEFACKILTGDESVLEDAIAMQKLFDVVLWTSKDLHPTSPPTFAPNVKPETPIELDNVSCFNPDRTIQTRLQSSDMNKRHKMSKN